MTSTALPARSPKPVFRCALCLVFLVPILALSGCAPRGETTALPADHVFALELGDRTVHVELAVTQEELSRGLMYREELAEDRGMLFVFRTPRQMGFFMRNTSIPLDIGYFSPSGVLREVYAMHPFDETTVASRSDRLQFALEMNQGWFSENEVRPGAELDLEAVTEAIRERGFDPEVFGL